MLFLKTEALSESPTPLELNLPPSRIGSISLLEAACMTALIRIVRARRIFEFGTFLGYSTALFLGNSDPDCEVVSIDLGDVSEVLSEAASYRDREVLSDDRKNDDHLRLTQARLGPLYLRDRPDAEMSRLTLIHRTAAPWTPRPSVSTTRSTWSSSTAATISRPSRRIPRRRGE